MSSRLWNVFEDGLGQDPDLKIYTQDLTREDINACVRSKLQQHAHWPLFSADGSRHEKLVEEITEKAQVVFLRVFLVTRSLFEGLTNSDALSALQMRIRQLPTDLEQYFRHMLSSVDPFCYTQMANAFLAAPHTSSHFPLMLYSFLDDLAEVPSSLFNLPFRGMEREDILFRHQQMRRRINGRCKGLLEVYHDSRNVQSNPDIYTGYRVDFLHRTVKDFLDTREMTDFILTTLSWPLASRLRRQDAVHILGVHNSKRPRVFLKDRLSKELDADGPKSQDVLFNTVLAPPLCAGPHQPDLTGILSHLLSLRHEPIQDKLWEGYLVQCLYAFSSANGLRDGSATAVRHRYRAIELLLSHGARPGIRSTSQLAWRGDPMMPIWVQFLFLANSSTQASQGLEDECWRVVSASLRAGADPNDTSPG